jgi:EAL domain-containing protein (putative c-di-GMP-specific phosphodiesterase class I)
MSQTNHHVEPIRRGGGMRRLRQGNLRRAEDRSTTVLSRTQFQAVLQAEIERAVVDELTLLVMRTQIRPLPGAGDDGFVPSGLPTDLVERLVECHENIRVMVAGSTELIMLVPSLRRRPEGEELVSTLLELLKPPIEVDGLPHHLSPTIGAAMLDHESPSADLLIDGARLALAECDATNPGMIFHPYQRVRHDRRKEIESDLRTAVLNQEIGCALQPAFDLNTGALVAFEAFARWNRANKGPVPAIEFVEMARELGIDHFLGRQVLQGSLTTLAGVLDTVGQPADKMVTLWLNVSPTEVLHPEFVATIIAAMGNDARIRIGLELSPSPPSDARDVHQNLKRLVARGARVAIGDFGIGNANLTVLQQLPFDAVKLDRALIRQIAGNEAAADMVKALIEMASLLNLETTAQGVENESQLEVLQNLGCQIGQGYFFGEPSADLQTLQAWCSNPYAQHHDDHHGEDLDHRGDYEGGNH